MANFTPNYNLRKPVGTEQFDIDRDFNVNWDVIDGELKEIDTTIKTIKIDEAARQTKETERQASETSRTTAETGRVNAESSRVTAEQGRVSAEQERVSAEAARHSEVILARGTEPTLGARLDATDAQADVVLRNEISNGSFNTQNGWLTYGAIITTKDSSAEFVSSTKDGQMYQPIYLNKGEVYYISVGLESTSVLVGVRLQGVNFLKEKAGEEVLQFKIIGEGRNTSIGISDTRVSGWDKVIVKNFSCVNLTQFFGKENEPTLEYIKLHTIRYNGDVLLTQKDIMDVQSDKISKISNRTNFTRTISKEDSIKYISSLSSSQSIIRTTDAIGKNIEDALTTTSSGSYILEIPLDNVSEIEFPVFKSVDNNGSAITDKDGVIIWTYSTDSMDTGTPHKITIPEDSFTLFLSISPTLSLMEWNIIITENIANALERHEREIDDLNKMPSVYQSRVGFLPFLSNISDNSKNSLSLCAIKTDIVNDAIPFQRGYLFHKLPNDDGSLWYGSKLDNAVKIGTSNPTFVAKDSLLAVSPKDGRVIAARRGERGNLFVWDGETTFSLFDNSDIKPMGWLYNAGVDFINDVEGNEYCVFAEYRGGSADGFRVWKGSYPYTSESDWKVAFHQEANAVHHFHQIRRDPWSNTLYLTAGDYPGQLKWWYSTDVGETWVLLTDNATNGWEEHTCRCINFIFTKDYIYWATDYGINHSLNRIKRDPVTSLIDISTREKLCDLPYAQATNSICLVENPNGIFMFDRVDWGFEDHYGGGFDLMFWSLDLNRLINIGHINLTNDSWGGNRGKCYSNYTNGQEPRPAIGFSDDTRCYFDIVGADSENIGTVFYDL